MEFLKKIPSYLLLFLLLGLFIWAVFIPKENFMERVEKTLADQKKRADLFFSTVTAAEIVEGQKYWELRAKSSSLNKSMNVTWLQGVNGTFFEDGIPALKIIAPSAIWHMNNKEIFLNDPIGYDTKFEKSYGHKIHKLREIDDPRSVFRLPDSGSPDDIGYWFKAHNLSWKLATKRIICVGGITLTKGNVMVLANELEADVAMEHVFLRGSPMAMIDGVSFEATTIEVDSLQDYLYAEGGVRAKRDSAIISSESATYMQRINEIGFAKEVALLYKDLQAWGSNAKYFLESDNAILFGDASALRGGSSLTGDEVHIDFRDDKVSVVGETKVKIREEELNMEK